MDELLSKSQNKFLLANALGKRAKQISEGSLPYVDDFNPANPIITAMKEIAAERIKVKVLQGPLPKTAAESLAEEPKKKRSLAKEKKKKTKVRK
jgi:DNA-directed RNA polymerase subunit K/omega